MTLQAGALGVPESRVLTPLTPDFLATQGMMNGTVGSSAAYPTASMALFYPVYLTQPRTYVKAFWVNGAAVAGNIDVGIYTLSGTTMTRVVASAAEAQATISVMQVAATFATTTIGPGRYYLAISATSTSATTWRVQPNAFGAREIGFFQAATSSPLPSSVTVVTMATAQIPLFGFSEEAAI